MRIDSHYGFLDSIRNFFQKKQGRTTQIAPYSDTEYIDTSKISSRQILRLSEAISYNYRKMDTLRKSAKQMHKQYAGHMYSEDGSEKTVVINKLQDAVRIYLQNLASGQPRVSVEPEYANLRPFANSFERAVNCHLSEIRIGSEFSRATFNAIFSAGILKTGLAAGSPEIIEIDGQWYDPGRAFTANVNLNDFVIDMAANSMEQVEFIGDRFLRPKEWITQMLKRARRGEPYNGGVISDRMESQMQPEEPITGRDDPEKRLYDMGFVWEIFLPKENLIICIPDGVDEAIAMFPFDGPEGGPYDILGFMPAPDGPMPVPIGMSLFELHMFANEIMRKVGRQANRQKGVLVVEAGGEKGAEIIRTSDDGGTVVVPAGTLQKLQEMKYGGADPLNAQMLAWVLQQFDQEGGNLQSLGGLGPSAETFRGDKLIHDTASALINFMSIGVLKTARDVLKKHAWWVWTEDIRSYNGQFTVPNTNIVVPWSFTPEEREGDFLDFNFQIDPCSLRERTPTEKASQVMELWTNFVMPNAELAMQSGLMPNFQGTVDYLCRHLDVPMDILFTPMDPRMQMALMNPDGQTPAPPRMKQSHTVNERVSRPGTTPNGNDNVFMQSMSAMASQAS